MQVRGYKLRLPLDLMLVASANPEDYTNRGRIITPLKDRFGSQIRTHYPLDVDTEVAIADQEARPLEVDRRAGHRAGLHGRDRGHAQPPGPRAAATSTSARACRCASRCPTARPSSPTPPAGPCATASARSCPGSATSTPWPRRPWARSRSRRSTTAATGRWSSTWCARRCSPCSAGGCRWASCARSSRRSTRARSSTPATTSPRATWPACWRMCPPCASRPSPSPAATRTRPCWPASVELVLEGLHLSKRLNKDAVGDRATYRSRG